MTELPSLPLDDAATRIVTMIQATAQSRGIAQTALELLARATNSEWGVYWEVEKREQHLRAVAIWTALDPKSRPLEQVTRLTALLPGQGNAGHVWRRRKPLWTTRLVAEMCLPRSLVALEAGLQGGVWFPVKTSAGVYGVIELLARAVEPKSLEELDAFERLGVRLGMAIEASLQIQAHLH